MTGEKTDFTQGSILRKLCLFMLPVLGALILQVAYGAVDLLVVGRFGSTSGLSAVSTGSQVLNLVTFVVTQLAMGVTLTASYVRICGGGTFFIVAYNLLSAIFRGLGDSRSPLLFVLVACLVNVAGDLLLVAGLGMDAVVVRSGFAYLKGFAPETIMTVVLFSMVGYFNGSGRTLWVMVQGLVQTLLARLPLAYCMSIQPNASLTKIGLAAPVSTAVGILLNVAFYIYLDRRTKKDVLLPIPEK